MIMGVGGGGVYWLRGLVNLYQGGSQFVWILSREVVQLSMCVGSGVILYP